MNGICKLFSANGLRAQEDFLRSTAVFPLCADAQLLGANGCWGELPQVSFFQHMLTAGPQTEGFTSCVSLSPFCQYSHLSASQHEPFPHPLGCGMGLCQGHPYCLSGWVGDTAGAAVLVCSSCRKLEEPWSCFGKQQGRCLRFPDHSLPQARGPAGVMPLGILGAVMGSVLRNCQVGPHWLLPDGQVGGRAMGHCLLLCQRCSIAAAMPRRISEALKMKACPLQHYFVET